VLPEQWANLSFRAGGPIVELKVQSGDTVKAGDLIAQLDDVDAQLAVAQAEAALAMAQAQLAELKAGARAEQIAQAEQAVAQAEAAWQGAQAQYDQLRSGARAADIAAAEAAVAQAAAQLKVAQDAYDKVTQCVNVPGHGEVCPGLGTPEEQARAALNAAKEAHNAAQKRVAQLKAGATKNELAAASANIDAAKAQLEQAKAQRDLLKAGASPEQIAVAEAGVKQAQVALDVAKAQLDKLQLIAPFDGTIGTVTVRSGEVAAPGQPIVTLGDLGSLRVETTDLSETDIARVKEGQTVKVTFDALPGKTITGKVLRIAPMSTPGQSAVNYIVTVQLDEIDPALRWGMTAFVDVQVGE
jgi:HlyD family secretion protein